MKKKNMVAAAENPRGRLTPQDNRVNTGFSSTRDVGDSQKHHLHPGPSVSKPPINGPATLETPNVTPNTPIYAALVSGFTVKAIMINAPVIVPPPPMPATTRPNIRVELLGARAQMMFPTSKTAIASKKVFLRGKYVYAFPQELWKAVFVIM